MREINNGKFDQTSLIGWPKDYPLVNQLTSLYKMLHTVLCYSQKHRFEKDNQNSEIIIKMIKSDNKYLSDTEMWNGERETR